MAKAIKKLMEFTYVLDEDKEKEDSEKTIFKLRPLNGPQHLEVLEATSNGSTSRAHFLALRYGLVGWENFKDEEGLVQFLPDMQANICRLSSTQIMELGRKIRDACLLLEEERKNS